MYGFASIRRSLKLNQEFKFPLRTYFSYNNKPKQQVTPIEETKEGRSEGLYQRIGYQP